MRSLHGARANEAASAAATTAEPMSAARSNTATRAVLTDTTTRNAAISEKATPNTRYAG